MYQNVASLFEEPTTTQYEGEDNLQPNLNSNYGSSTDLTAIDFAAAIMQQYPELENASRDSEKRSERIQNEVANAMAQARIAEITQMRRAARAKYAEGRTVPAHVRDGLYRVQLGKHDTQLFSVSDGVVTLVNNNPLVSLEIAANAAFIESLDSSEFNEDTEEMEEYPNEVVTEPLPETEEVPSTGAEATEKTEVDAETDYGSEDENPSVEG